MGPSPTYDPPEGEECETSVEHGLPLKGEPAVGYCSRRPRPSAMWGSRCLGARAVGRWVGEQKPLGKTLLRGNPSPEMTYPPTPPHGAGLLTTVRKNPSELKRQVDALHTKQEEVQQGQETILSQLRTFNGLVS